MSTRDLFDILDAAYRLDLGNREWLSAIVNAARPTLDRGFGLCAFEFQFGTETPPRVLQARMVGMPDELVQLYPMVFTSMSPEFRTRPFTHGPCTSASQMTGLGSALKQHPLMRQHAQRFGIFDSLWITAAEPSGHGVGLHAGRGQISRVSSATRALWSRLGAHLSAATRLRRRLAVTPREPAAIFRSDGHLEHLACDELDTRAVGQLRASVLTLQHVRSASCAGASLPKLDAWKGLVDGRWSLLDKFESDGRRYVVAHANAPAPPPHEALTTRERQVLGYAALGHHNKAIAYDLGISHSTVRVLLARAAARLGVKSRAELITAFQGLMQGRAPAGPNTVPSEVPA